MHNIKLEECRDWLAHICANCINVAIYWLFSEVTIMIATGPCVRLILNVVGQTGEAKAFPLVAPSNICKFKLVQPLSEKHICDMTCRDTGCNVMRSFIMLKK